MATATVRFGKKFETLMQRDIREFDYSTKTEYIRQAVRELHERLSTERAIRQLAKNKGFAKRAGYKDLTQEEYEKNREEAAREYFKKLKFLQAGQP